MSLDDLKCGDLVKTNQNLFFSTNKIGYSTFVPGESLLFVLNKEICSIYFRTYKINFLWKNQIIFVFASEMSWCSVL